MNCNGIERNMTHILQWEYGAFIVCMFSLNTRGSQTSGAPKPLVSLAVMKSLMLLGSSILGKPSSFGQTQTSKCELATTCSHPFLLSRDGCYGFWALHGLNTVSSEYPRCFQPPWSQFGHWPQHSDGRIGIPTLWPSSHSKKCAMEILAMAHIVRWFTENDDVQ